MQDNSKITAILRGFKQKRQKDRYMSKNTTTNKNCKQFPNMFISEAVARRPDSVKYFQKVFQIQNTSALSNFSP